MGKVDMFGSNCYPSDTSAAQNLLASKIKGFLTGEHPSPTSKKKLSRATMDGGDNSPSGGEEDKLRLAWEPSQSPTLTPSPTNGADNEQFFQTSKGRGDINKNLSSPSSSPALSPCDEPAPTKQHRRGRFLFGRSFSTSSRSGSASPRLPGSPRRSRAGSCLVRSKNGDKTGSPPAHKQVLFTDRITVHRMDDSGHVSTSMEALCNEPKETYKSFYNRPRYGEILPSCLEPLMTSEEDQGGFYTRRRHSFGNDDRDALSRDFYDAQLLDEASRGRRITDVTTRGGRGGAYVVSETNSARTSEVTFARHPGGVTKMRFVLTVGQEYKADDVVVKANVNGNRIRVVAKQPSSPPPTRAEGATGSSEDENENHAGDFIEGNTNQRLSMAAREQLNERYILPFDVDPYMVEAKLDSRGQLTVEAPLMTVSRRQELIENLTKLDISR